MSSVTGEASQNRCPHLAPTAASSHRIRGVPGRTLPCSCLSPKIKRASEQKSLPGKGWRRLAPAASGCTSCGTKPSTHELRARHAGVAGEGLGALGGLCKGGRLSHVVVFGTKQAQIGRKNWWRALRGGYPSWEMSRGTSLPYPMGVCAINPACIPWQGVWLPFPAGEALPGVGFSTQEFWRVPAVEVSLQMGPGLVSRLPGELRCPFIQ